VLFSPRIRSETDLLATLQELEHLAVGFVSLTEAATLGENHLSTQGGWGKSNPGHFLDFGTWTDGGAICRKKFLRGLAERFRYPSLVRFRVTANRPR